MRNPILACLGLVIGVSAFACASSETPDLADIIASRDATDPADAGDSVISERGPSTSTNTGPATTATTPVAPPPIVFNPDAGSPDAGRGDDDDDAGSSGAQNCPQTDAYEDEALTAALLGGATPCANGPSACASDECCVVNAISATANLCVPK